MVSAAKVIKVTIPNPKHMIAIRVLNAVVPLAPAMAWYSSHDISSRRVRIIVAYVFLHEPRGCLIARTRQHGE